jgi:hypothetical protein
MNKKIIVIMMVMVLIVSSIVIAPEVSLPIEGGGGGTTPAEEAKEQEGQRQAEEAIERRSRQLRGEGTPPAPIAIYSFMGIYNQYSGLARFGSLFFTHEQDEQWREKVNQFFCDTILLGGTQCWTSRICSMGMHMTTHRNTLADRAPWREHRPLVSIQAEKSLPIQTPDGTKYLYKITYSITNPYDTIKLDYAVEVRREDGSTYQLEPWKKLRPGMSATISEATPILRYGKSNYAEACLIFDPAIVDYTGYWHGKRRREMCAGIVQYQGDATRPYPTAAGTPPAATPAPPPASQPGEMP